MKKIFFLIDNAFNHDARVVREAKSLKEAGFNLIVFALKEKEFSLYESYNGIPVYRIFDNRIFKIWEKKYHKKVALKISNLLPDIVHCHDQTMLNIATYIKKHLPNIKIVYDTHELFKYWPINYSPNAGLWLKIKSWIVRKYEVHREKNNSKQIDFLITVNKSLADILKKEFKLKTAPIIIRNVPNKTNNLSIQKNEKFKDDIIKIAYVGAGIYPKTRNLENALLQLGQQKNIEIHLFGGYKGNPEYFKNLVKTRNLNVVFYGKILPEKIIENLQTSHIGLVTTWNKKDLSYWFALDNKLFYYLHAGLPILCTAQPEYIEIVEKYKVGVCINPDNSTFTEGLYKIIQNYQEYRLNVLKTRELLNWENESLNLLNLYNNICPQP